MCTPSAVPIGVYASGVTTSPGALVQSPQVVSKENEGSDSPSPELGARAARELR